MPSRVIAMALLALSAAGCVGRARTVPVMTAPPAAAPAPDVTPAELGTCEGTTLPRARVWRLTHVQVKNSLEDVFGFSGMAVAGLPMDARLEGYGNLPEQLAVPPLLMDRYHTVAEEIGSHVVRGGGAARILPCAPAALAPGSACARAAVTGLGERLWRRPLSPAEIARLTQVHATVARATNGEKALQTLIKALLLSPNFLFRSELGQPAGSAGAISRLTDHEIASALSFLLWNTGPDTRLLSLAAGGKLREPGTREAEARRLLASPQRAAPALVSFVRQWLGVDQLPSLRKDRKLFPRYGNEMAADFLEETRLFVDSVVFAPDGDRSLRTLLTASHGFASNRTARIYGVEIDSLTPVRTEFDPRQRRGLLTHGAFLAAHAGPDATKVVDRGRFVRERILCGEVPDPPDDFRFDDAKITDDMTAREKFSIHAKNPFCARCHALFDGIGFALERYDAIGMMRDTEHGKPIDPSGSLTLPESKEEVKFDDFVSLVGQLADRPEVYACFASQYLRYATGRRPEEISACESRAMAQAFAGGGHRLDNLVLAIVRSPAFILRRN